MPIDILIFPGIALENYSILSLPLRNLESELLHKEVVCHIRVNGLTDDRRRVRSKFLGPFLIPLGFGFFLFLLLCVSGGTNGKLILVPGPRR